MYFTSYLFRSTLEVKDIQSTTKLSNDSYDLVIGCYEPLYNSLLFFYVGVGFQSRRIQLDTYILCGALLCCLTFATGYKSSRGNFMLIILLYKEIRNEFVLFRCLLLCFCYWLYILSEYLNILACFCKIYIIE